MGSRRRSRELAMQALFYMDSRQLFGSQYVQLFCHCCPPSSLERPLFEHITNGVLNLRRRLDPLIERFSSNWKISRMSCVDRNVLRIAVFEMLCCADIPAKVSINEAIDIGKKFGTEESGAFINGILDSIRLAIEGGQILPDEFPNISLAEDGEDGGLEERASRDTVPGDGQASAAKPLRPVRLTPRVMKRPRSNSA